MKGTEIAVCLLITVMALAGPSFGMSQAQSGPFTLTVDSPSIGGNSPQPAKAQDGTEFIAYIFNIGSGTILVAEFQKELTNYDPLVNIRNGYPIADPQIKPEDIQTQSQTIDGHDGVIGQAYSPQESAIIYEGIYLLDPYTKVVVTSTGDAQLFDNMINSIHVQKNGQPSYSTSQTVSQSALLSSSPKRGESTLFNQPSSKNEIIEPVLESHANEQPLVSIGGSVLNLAYVSSQKIMGSNVELYQARLEKDGSVIVLSCQFDLPDINNETLTALAKQFFPMDFTSVETHSYEIDGLDGVVAKAFNSSTKQPYYAALYMPDGKTICGILTSNGQEFDNVVHNIHFERIESSEQASQSNLLSLRIR
jgi:hypothetical protein